MRAILNGFSLPFRGLGLLIKPGLRRYVAVPLFLNVVIFAGLAYLAGSYFDAFMDRWLPTQDWLAFLRWLLWVLFASTYALAAFYGFTLLANLIGAPFNAMLAARVEEKLTGRAPIEAHQSLLRAIGPALGAELGKIWYFVSRALPLLVLFFIPGLNVLVSLGWLVFGFWFLAIEYTDYPLSNHGLSAREQRAWLRNMRTKSLAFGAGTSLLMVIPVIQLAAMPAAVAAATRFWVEDGLSA